MLPRDRPAPSIPLAASTDGEPPSTPAQAARRDKAMVFSPGPAGQGALSLDKRGPGPKRRWPPPQFLPTVLLLGNQCQELGLGRRPAPPSVTALVPGR